MKNKNGGERFLMNTGLKRVLGMVVGNFITDSR